LRSINQPAPTIRKIGAQTSRRIRKNTCGDQRGRGRRCQSGVLPGIEAEEHAPFNPL
jgi:hypothetical protein